MCGAEIDSREIGAGQVFFAHRGEHADGHRFVGAALRAGAAACVIDDPDALDPGALALGPILRVASVTDAMVALARAYRGAMRTTTVIGVTGSSGKTTTVRMIESVLCQRLRGSASAKSHNNTLGVCLTILNSLADSDYLVGEVGSSAPGEIAALCEILRPDICVITSIGRAHVEGLRSIEGIAHEKAAIMNRLGPDGLALVPASCNVLETALATTAHVVRVGTGGDADLRVGNVASGDRGVRFQLGGSRFEVGGVGAHNAINGAFAVAIGRAMGLGDDEIRAGLLRVKLPAMRLQLEYIGGVTILNDAYNANPDSMLAAIETLEHMEHAGRRVAVLGDMLELGDAGPAAHREIGERLARGSVGLAVLVGAAMREAHEVLAASGVASVYVPDGESFEILNQEIRDGDLVLVKGSRGMRMERAVAALRESRVPELKITSRVHSSGTA